MPGPAPVNPGPVIDWYCTLKKPLLAPGVFSSLFANPTAAVRSNFGLSDAVAFTRKFSRCSASGRSHSWRVGMPSESRRLLEKSGIL